MTLSDVRKILSKLPRTKELQVASSSRKEIVLTTTQRTTRSRASSKATRLALICKHALQSPQCEGHAELVGAAPETRADWADFKIVVRVPR